MNITSGIPPAVSPLALEPGAEIERRRRICNGEEDGNGARQTSAGGAEENYESQDAEEGMEYLGRVSEGQDQLGMGEGASPAWSAATIAIVAIRHFAIVALVGAPLTGFAGGAAACACHSKRDDEHGAARDGIGRFGNAAEG
jgi:hypothetical protein